MAWSLRRVDGTANALRYLIGRYPLAQWEVDLITAPWPDR